jgi:pyrophosphatase PpaX
LTRSIRGPTSQKVSTVLFDFDGTLADSTTLIMESYRHTMRVHLGEVPPDERWLSGFGTPLEAQIARFSRGPEEHAAMLDTYREYQGAHYDRLLRPFDGAVDAVAALARRGVRLAIVTSRHRRSTLRGMELCGLLDHFPVVVTPEDVAQPKPHPEPVLHALRRLDADPAETIFIGDSPHDIAAGRAAGTRTAGALWGPFPRATLESSAPDWLFESCGELLDIVG